MVLKKRGQAMFFTLMLGVVVIILALALAPAVKQTSDTAQAPSTNETVGLDCMNNSISDFNKAQCFFTDLSTPYFFFGFIGIAGAIIGARLILA